MRKYWIIILITGMTFAISCTKVNNLSDEAGFESFNILNATDNIELGKATFSRDVVSIPIEFGRKYFPLTISTDITFTSTTHSAISVDAEPLNLREFTFSDVYTPQTFYMISASGVPHLATIMLIDKRNAEINEFKITNITTDAPKVLPRNNDIRLIFKEDPQWPISIIPEINKTESAVYTDYTPGEPLVFESSTDRTKKITLKAENGDERVWNIQIVPPIENSDFELWDIDEVKNTVNINPIPGKGLGWTTANNIFVSGTKPATINGSTSAQMTTEIQELSSMGIGDLVTAGTIFTGLFRMNVSQLSNPVAMTYFGIPFILRPDSVSFDASYISGNILQQSVKNKDGKFQLQNLPGKDEGHVWVEILHWAGKGDLEYHSKPITGLTVLGRTEYVFKGDNQTLKDWAHYSIPIRYVPEYNDMEPTHIAVVMTSSRQGDYFIGAKGSQLTVDNFKTKYNK